MTTPRVVSQGKDPFVFIPAAKAWDQMTVKAELLRNADHAVVALGKIPGQAV